MLTKKSSERSSDEFFIGWLPPPVGNVRFLRPIVVGLIALVATFAAGVAFFQRSPGSAQWVDDTAPLQGIVYVRPYAMLRAHAPGRDGPVQTILLVGGGKFGALDRVQRFDGQAVRVTGTFLHRDERWMVELNDGEAGLRPLATMPEEEQQRLRLPPAEALGEITLAGEVIDSKCYLGAMKPGGGKTHKACAALCISGGVPPMLVTRDAEKNEAFYLLTTRDGKPIDDFILPFIGDPIRLSGQFKQQGDLRLLEISPNDVQRR